MDNGTIHLLTCGKFPPITLAECKQYPYTVYFLMPSIINPDRVKIGLTKSLIRRKRDLENACGQNLKCIWSIKMPTREHASALERAFHEHLDSERMRGEWFHFTEKIKHLLEALDSFYLTREAANG